MSHSHLITLYVRLLNSNLSDGINLPTDFTNTIMLFIRQLITSTTTTNINPRLHLIFTDITTSTNSLHENFTTPISGHVLFLVFKTKESSHLNHNHRFPIPIHGCTSDVLKWTVRIQPAALYATCPLVQVFLLYRIKRELGGIHKRVSVW